MTDELKPCPFCGGVIEWADIVDPEGYGKWHYVHCPKCGVDGPPDLGESGAIEQWNTRPGEARLQALVDLQQRDCTE